MLNSSHDAATSDETTVSAVSSSYETVCVLAISFMLFRMSIDLIQTASQNTTKDYTEDHHNAVKDKAKPRPKKLTSYGSLPSGSKSSKDTLNGGENETDASVNVDPEQEKATLLSSFPHDHEKESNFSVLLDSSKPATWSFRFQCLLLMLLLIAAIFHVNRVLSSSLVWSCVVVVLFGAILTYRDVDRERFGIVSRVVSLAASLMLTIPLSICYYQHRQDTASGDEWVVNVMSLYTLLSLGECFFVALPLKPLEDRHSVSSTMSSTAQKRRLSSSAILILLKPYFWPDETAESATMNRIRAIVTWVCVILSKVCNLVSPILLGWASTALAHEDYARCIYLSIAYSAIQFFGAAFKEGQSLVYLKVAQAAFIQLSEAVFVHLHQLSMDWHLQKKLGEVIRSMDRGIAACDTLMKYLFLWLVPALAECLVVCIIFATYFHYAPLAICVFYFVWMYIVWTILVTLWRKKFRKAVVKSDNEWHDRATDSLVNFETVKYFTGEEFERQRFGESISKYQAGSVAVQASLSFLNISQRAILQLCLGVALSLSALGIKQRIDCCIDHGCDSGVSSCCQALDNDTCPGMQVGDFVAVLTYTMQLFQPLNFLGSVYNAVVMAIIDLTNLSELLAESPDVVDAPGAIPLPKINADDEELAVEFDNVVFHYPTQSSNKGLKGVSFKMKRGTTTAIVGPTGAGKTTISRLFFRFYDVLGGAVKVNGKDVRTVTQKSLRGSIGVVPQNAIMFNDTIRENLRYGRRDATQAELDQAARDAQLFDFIESLELGWDTVVGDRGLKLSGGEKQRAAIARCLLKDPPFVLLDEATSALDTITERSVQEALDRLGSRRTVLVIAHRLGTIRNADNIIVLKEGVVAEQGTHDELLEKQGTYAAMWEMQLHSASNAGSQVDLLAASDST
ncbi:ABC transporter [Nitzschia inconspicua]|uniref:ABC transporter n=1 Tax=Nitzschia inconspicua TaxID=303405 RepID=A0A9K3KIJ8_9STRA|nr:ABC transporter [Nitzschia inconspicua]